MEFKEVKKLGKYFEKYLTYDGINLWKVGEAAMYNNFLKNPPNKSLFNKPKAKLVKYYIHLENRLRENCTKNKAKKEIIFIVNGITQVNVVRPLFNRLNNSKIIKYDSPFENTTKKFLKNEGLSYLGLDCYMNKGIKDQLKKSSFFLTDAWKEIKNEIIFKDIFGRNYDSILLALEYFISTRRIYLEYIRLIELYKEMFEIEKPRTIVVFDDVNAYGKIVALVAKRFNVKTFCIQHGQLQGNPVGEITCDKMIVSGEEDKKFLISKGAENEKIIVSGQIRFDDISKIRALSREELCKKLGMDPKKKIIVYSYQKPEFRGDVIETALECFKENLEKIEGMGYQIILTARKDVRIPNILKRKQLKILRGVDPMDLAVCSDVLVTAYSTLAIEFVLMNRPIITLNLGPEHFEYIDYTKKGVGFKVTKKENFLKVLSFCLENRCFQKRFRKSREKFVRDYNYKMDGKALERILKIIKT